MAYTYGPNGEIFDEAGNLISRATSSGQLPPEAPGGNLQATGQQGTSSVKSPTGQGGTDSGSGQQQQTPQSSIPNLVKPIQNIANLLAQRRAGGMGGMGAAGGMSGRAGAVYDASGNLVTSSGNLTAQQAAGTGATMMPGGGVRDPSGNVWDSSANLTAQDIGGTGATMPGAGAGAGGGMISPQMGNALAGGIGAIGSALQSAFSNVPSWKIQPSAIPDPTSFTRNVPQYDFQRRPIV
jgi:hypothetical protein